MGARATKPASQHNTAGKLLVGYKWCRKCGLLYLRNAATAEAVRQPCQDDRHDGET